MKTQLYVTLNRRSGNYSLVKLLGDHHLPIQAESIYFVDQKYGLYPSNPLSFTPYNRITWTLNSQVKQFVKYRTSFNWLYQISLSMSSSVLVFQLNVLRYGMKTQTYSHESHPSNFYVHFCFRSVMSFQVAADFFSNPPYA